MWSSDILFILLMANYLLTENEDGTRKTFLPCWSWLRCVYCTPRATYKNFLLELWNLILGCKDFCYDVGCKKSFRFVISLIVSLIYFFSATPLFSLLQFFFSVATPFATSYVIIAITHWNVRNPIYHNSWKMFVCIYLWS